MNNKKLAGLLSLFWITGFGFSTFADHRQNDLRERLRWVNTQALELAIQDMRQSKGFDYPAAKANLDYIVRHLPAIQGRLDDPNNLAAFDHAAVLLEKQRAILTSNSLLDIDKIVATRFVLGDNARQASTNEMCMPMSNYMGLIDVPSSVSCRS